MANAHTDHSATVLSNGDVLVVGGYTGAHVSSTEFYSRALTRSPISLAFGSRDIDDGATAEQESTVTNTGTDSITVSGVTVGGSGAAHFERLTGQGTDCANGTVLGAGQTCKVRARFDPTSTGTKSATVTVTTDAEDPIVGLSGTATQQLELSRSPDTLAFGSRDIDDGPTATQESTVTNTGTDSVTLTGITLGGTGGAHFERLTGQGTDCTDTTTLTSGQTCKLRTRFDPTSTGAKSATITVVSNAPDVTVALSGIGIQTELSATWWKSVGSMTLARSGVAVLVLDDRVLMTGGFTSIGDGYDTKPAEIFDPSTDSWSSGGATTHGRAGHVAAVLQDGKAIVAGGIHGNLCINQSASGASAELFDPSTGMWSATGSMGAGRFAHSATPLLNGKVLVAGGGDRCGTVFSSVELYDPSTGMWSSTGSMTRGRENHAAIRLADGRVLVVGGLDHTLDITNTAEIYDPSTGMWTATTGSMATDRQALSATRLSDGRVMVTGGYTGNPFSPSPAGPAVEIFDPSTGAWSATGSLSVGRSNGSLSRLENGMVLAAGGTNGVATHASAELWDPAAGTWSSAATMRDARSGHSAVTLDDGDVLAAGGFAGAHLASAERYVTEVAPSTVSRAFGSRDIDDGPTAAQEVTLTNTGSEAIAINALTLGGTGAAHFERLTGQGTDCTDRRR